MDEIALKNMLVNAVVDTLMAALVTNIAPLDPTRATTVRAGKLQDNPTKETGISVLVWPSEDDEPDGLYIISEQTGIYTNTYTGGMGNSTGMHTVHRMRVMFKMHNKLSGEDGRQLARERAHRVISRARYALVKMPMPLHPITGAPTDDFGESVFLIQIRKWHTTESGGTGNYIWNAQILIDFLAEQNVPY